MKPKSKRVWDQKPDTVLLDATLTINGGDIRDDAMRDIAQAMLSAFKLTAAKHGLGHPNSVRLRSVTAKQMARIRERAFGVTFPADAEHSTEHP